MLKLQRRAVAQYKFQLREDRCQFWISFDGRQLLSDLFPDLRIGGEPASGQFNLLVCDVWKMKVYVGRPLTKLMHSVHWKYESQLSGGRMEERMCRWKECWREGIARPISHYKGSPESEEGDGATGRGESEARCGNEVMVNGRVGTIGTAEACFTVIEEGLAQQTRKCGSCASMRAQSTQKSQSWGAF
jgi:hypothetical protein